LEICPSRALRLFDFIIAASYWSFIGDSIAYGDRGAAAVIDDIWLRACCAFLNSATNPSNKNKAQ
jgi:hypothetical protein